MFNQKNNLSVIKNISDLHKNSLDLNHILKLNIAFNNQYYK